MNRFFPVLLSAFLLTLFSASRPNVIPLTIIFEGLKNEQGQVMVRLQDEQGNTVKNISHPIAELPPQLKLRLPAGSYALAAFHDENGNGELDRAWTGMPQEAYGFSNGLRGSILGPPDLEDQLFTLQSARELTIEIK